MVLQQNIIDMCEAINIICYKCFISYINVQKKRLIIKKFADWLIMMKYKMKKKY